MTKKALTEKEFNEIENKLPKPLLECLDKNLDKPNTELISYMMGYFQGIKYVIEFIGPIIKRMDEILNK